MSQTAVWPSELHRNQPSTSKETGNISVILTYLATGLGTGIVQGLAPHFFFFRAVYLQTVSTKPSLICLPWGGTYNTGVPEATSTDLSSSFHSIDCWKDAAMLRQA